MRFKASQLQEQARTRRRMCRVEPRTVGGYALREQTTITTVLDQRRAEQFWKDVGGWRSAGDLAQLL